MSDINETARAICVDQDINTIVPLDAPCVWISRDVSYARMSSLVDVWTRSPKRWRTDHGVEFVDGGNGEQSTLLGRFTTMQIISRFGIVPSGDECIYVDNPKVN